uniref:Putative secreted protein n=1 Tax=Anopheles darlingi TaxID=43151 RepID=A0A2M4D0P1_ANODA
MSCMKLLSSFICVRASEPANASSCSERRRLSERSTKLRELRLDKTFEMLLRKLWLRSIPSSVLFMTSKEPGSILRISLDRKESSFTLRQSENIFLSTYSIMFRSNQTSVTASILTQEGMSEAFSSLSFI